MADLNIRVLLRHPPMVRDIAHHIRRACSAVLSPDCLLLSAHHPFARISTSAGSA